MIVSSLHPLTYPLKVYQQIGICIHRSFLRIRSNPSATISAIMANSILGLVVGSAFYNTGETTDDLLNRSILLYFALIMNAFAPALEVGAHHYLEQYMSN